MERKKKGRALMGCQGVSVHNPNTCRNRKACIVVKGKFRHYCRRKAFTKKNKLPTPLQKTPTPKTPTPLPKTPSPLLKRPTPLLKTPTPKTPTPKTPTPKTPTPKTPTPKTPTPLPKTPSPLLKRPTPLLKTPTPLPKKLNTKKQKIDRNMEAYRIHIEKMEKGRRISKSKKISL